MRHPTTRVSPPTTTAEADPDFFYEGDASQLDARFVASVENMLGQRRKAQLARDYAGADALREGLQKSFGVVSSDHKQLNSRDPRTTWRVVTSMAKPPTPSDAHQYGRGTVKFVSATPEEAARKAVTVGGETLQAFLGRLGLQMHAATLHEEELTILDLPLATQEDLVTIGLPRVAAAAAITERWAILAAGWSV